jgi:4-hydroxybenzoate polyprenyltransferase
VFAVTEILKVKKGGFQYNFNCILASIQCCVQMRSAFLVSTLTLFVDARYHPKVMAEVKGGHQVLGWVAVKGIVTSMRPRQWTKNLIIYFAFFFTTEQAWELNEMEEGVRLFVRITAAFAIFCLITSAVYLFNDVLDTEKDRHHPAKRNRPVAAGVLSHFLALAIAMTLAVVGVSLAFILESLYAGVVLIYLVAMIAYSVYLKRLIIIDILVISLGFVLRAAAGAVVLDVTISPWLYICTTLGALFLGFAKRLNEIVLAGENGVRQRDTLEEYSPKFLEQLISIVAPATLVSYILYTFTADNLPDNNAMMLTIPFVMYGLFRYLYLVHNKNLGESPEQILLTDVPLILNITMWLAVAFGVLVAYR